MKTLYNKKDFPREQIIEFMNSLTTEKEFFLIGIDEVLQSEALIYEERDGRIAGIAGYRILPGLVGLFFRLPIGYIVVHKDFQGQALGKQLFEARYRVARERYNYLINTTSKNNNKMLGLMKKLDHKIIGETGDRLYFLKAFNFRGQCMYYLIKTGVALLIFIRSLGRG